MVALPVVALLGGVLATVVGLRPALVAAAALTVVSSVLALPVGVGREGQA